MSRPQDRRPPLTVALFGRMSLLLLIVVASVGAIAFAAASQRVNEVYDGQLIIGANVLRALMMEELHEVPPERGEKQLEVDDDVLLSPEDRRAFDAYAEWRMFRIWRAGGLLLRSDTGPPPAAPSSIKDGFSEVEAPDGRRWRIYTLRMPGHTIAVQVGERTDIRLELVSRIALGAALPLLLFIPLAAGLIWLSLSDGLSTLRLLMAELGRRSMRDLSPVPLEPWPADLHPMVRAINRMFARIERALQHERTFVDNAAHQLRTPLAAVRLQAQLIASETDPAERKALSERLIESVDRASTMTDNLLTLARLEGHVAPEPAGSGDLRTETVAAIADLAPLAARRSVELAFDGPARAPSGDPVLLRLIAANLIENALNHAPVGSEVAIRLAAGEAGVRLSVADHGPGIPAAERKKVLQRFYRGQPAGQSGSGLGLSIVSEAVRLLGGKLVLDDRADGGPGLVAAVELPLKAPAPAVAA
jgi:signal transduction histidine kinase